MRSILSPRFLAVAVAGVAAVAFAGATLVDRSPRSGTPPAPSLQEAARLTIAAGSARMTGTVTGADGATVNFEGVTSFRTPDTRVRAGADPQSGIGDSSIEVRTTGAGTWLRMPGVDRWIAVPQNAAGACGLPTGWGEVLRRLSRSTATADQADFEVDDRGRIRWLRFSDGGAGVEVGFRDFGVTVDVDPPPGASP